MTGKAVDLSKALDNAATASQSRDLLEPTTRGAVLRAIHQWIRTHDVFSEEQVGHLLNDLENHGDFGA